VGVILICTNIFKNYERETALFVSILNFIVSLIFFISFDFSSIDYQYVERVQDIRGIDLYFGIDSISLYFILLTTLITPIVLLSN
jgi:NADH-ubiquinone oxidoreductase chain 4